MFVTSWKQHVYKWNTHLTMYITYYATEKRIETELRGPFKVN